MVSIVTPSARLPANTAPTDLALVPALALPWVVGGAAAIAAAATAYYSVPSNRQSSTAAGTLVVKAVSDALRLRQDMTLDSTQWRRVEAHIAKLLAQAANPFDFFNSIRRLPQQIPSLLQFKAESGTQAPPKPATRRGLSPAPQGHPPGDRIIPPQQQQSERPCASPAVCVPDNLQASLALSQQRLQQQIKELNHRLSTLQRPSYRPSHTDLAQGSEAKQWKAFSQQVSAAKAALATLRQQLNAPGGTASTELKQFLNQATATLQAMPQQFLSAKANAYARAVQAVEHAMRSGQPLAYGAAKPVYQALANHAEWYSAEAGLNQFSPESRAGFEQRVGAYLQLNRNKEVPQGSAPVAEVSASPQELEELVKKELGDGDLAQDIIDLARQKEVSAEELAKMLSAKTGAEVRAALQDRGLSASGTPPRGGGGGTTTAAAGEPEDPFSPNIPETMKEFLAKVLNVSPAEVAAKFSHLPAGTLHRLYVNLATNVPSADRLFAQMRGYINNPDSTNPEFQLLSRNLRLQLSKLIAEHVVTTNPQLAHMPPEVSREVAHSMTHQLTNGPLFRSLEQLKPELLLRLLVGDSRPANSGLESYTHFALRALGAAAVEVRERISSNRPKPELAPIEVTTDAANFSLMHSALLEQARTAEAGRLRSASQRPYTHSDAVVTEAIEELLKDAEVLRALNLQGGATVKDFRRALESAPWSVRQQVLARILGQIIPSAAPPTNASPSTPAAVNPQQAALEAYMEQRLAQLPENPGADRTQLEEGVRNTVFAEIGELNRALEAYRNDPELANAIEAQLQKTDPSNEITVLDVMRAYLNYPENRYTVKELKDVVGTVYNKVKIGDDEDAYTARIQALIAIAKGALSPIDRRLVQIFAPELLTNRTP